MAISAFKKDSLGYYVTTYVNSDKDWGHDLTDQLVRDGGTTISSSEWTVPAEVTLGATGFSSSKTSAYLKPTSAGTHEIINTITAGGRTYIRKFRLIAR